MSLSEEEYEVEQIVKHRNVSGKLQYLIKWKDYSVEDNTWEAENNVFASDLVDAYWADHGGKEALEAARKSKKSEKAKPTKKGTKKSSSTTTTAGSSSTSKSPVKGKNKQQQTTSVALGSSSTWVPASSSKQLSSIPSKRDRTPETSLSDNDSSKRARLPNETNKAPSPPESQTSLATATTTTAKDTNKQSTLPSQSISSTDTPATSTIAQPQPLFQLKALRVSDASSSNKTASPTTSDTVAPKSPVFRVPALPAKDAAPSKEPSPSTAAAEKETLAAEINATTSSSLLTQQESTSNVTDEIADETSSMQVEVDTMEQQQIEPVTAPSPEEACTEKQLTAREETSISASTVDTESTTKRDTPSINITMDPDVAANTTIAEATAEQKEPASVAAEMENVTTTQDDEDRFMDDDDVMDKPAVSPTTLADATMLLDVLDDDEDNEPLDIGSTYGNDNTTIARAQKQTETAAEKAANKEKRSHFVTEDSMPPRTLEKDRGGDEKLLNYFSPYDRNIKGLAELGTDEVIYDASFPANPEDWANAKEVATVTRVPNDDGVDGDLYVVVRWNNGVLSLHPNVDARKYCPRQLIDFYEKSLKFVL